MLWNQPIRQPLRQTDRQTGQERSIILTPGELGAEKMLPTRDEIRFLVWDVCVHTAGEGISTLSPLYQQVAFKGRLD